MKSISRIITALVIAFIPVVMAGKNHETLLKAGETIALDYRGTPEVIVEARCAATSNRPTEGLGKARWGLAWNDFNGTSYMLTLRWGNEDFGTLTDRRYLLLSLTKGESTLFTNELTDGANLFKEPNTLKIAFDADGTMNWNVGGFALADAGSYNTGDIGPDPSTFRLFADGTNLNVIKLEIKPNPLSTIAPLTGLDSENCFILPADLSSSPQGVWLFLDRDTDARWARPGGQYTLGIIADDNGTRYTIIYLDGAIANSRRWKPGMMKGSLKGTPFSRHYDLKWVDATFDTIGKAEECWASMNDEGTILTLNFPLDRSVMRFYRKEANTNAAEN